MLQKKLCGKSTTSRFARSNEFQNKIICQKDYREDDDGTHYGTMFDKQFGIPVYSAYTLTEDNVDFKEWTRPKWRKTEGIYPSFR